MCQDGRARGDSQGPTHTLSPELDSRTLRPARHRTLQTPFRSRATIETILFISTSVCTASFLPFSPAARCEDKLEIRHSPPPPRGLRPFLELDLTGQRKCWPWACNIPAQSDTKRRYGYCSRRGDATVSSIAGFMTQSRAWPAKDHLENSDSQLRRPACRQSASWRPPS